VIKIRRMRLAGHVASMVKERGPFSVLFGRPEGKRPLEGPRRKWEYNIDVDLGEIFIEGAHWILQAQNSVQWRDLVNTVLNFWVP
jgi:hypothetical protein